MIVNLVCWHCQKSMPIQVTSEPQFGFELAGWANDVGWKGYADLRHRRALVFCSADHARAEMTKSGTFRLRAKGIKP